MSEADPSKDVRVVTWHLVVDVNAKDAKWVHDDHVAQYKGTPDFTILTPSDSQWGYWSRVANLNQW